MTTVPESPERDAALDAAWRAHSRDEPPAHLDAAILAAAHRAVRAGPSDARNIVAEATSPQRWWMPLAAAATIGAIAIGVLQLAPQEPAATAPYVSDMSARDMAPRAKIVAPEKAKIVAPEKKDAAAAATAPAPSPATPAQMAVAGANRPTNAGRAGNDADEAARVPRKQAQPQPFPAEADRRISESASAASNRARGVPANDKLEGEPVPVIRPTAPLPPLASAPAHALAPPAPALEPAPAPASAPPPHERGTAATLGKMTPGADAGSVSSRADQAFAPMPTPAIRSPATPVPSSAPVTDSPDIDAWIARIHKLFDDGKLPEAAKELTALRAAVPDADRRLPSDLRTWAATVKP